MSDSKRQEALRKYELAHKKWINTCVDSDAANEAKKELDEARLRYLEAIKAYDETDSGGMTPWGSGIPFAQNKRAERQAPAENGAIINPEWVDSLERELGEAKHHRNEWLWIYSQMVSILKGFKGWECAAEVADFHGGDVVMEGIKLAKVARHEMEQQNPHWRKE